MNASTIKNNIHKWNTIGSAYAHVISEWEKRMRERERDDVEWIVIMERTIERMAYEKRGWVRVGITLLL